MTDQNKEPQERNEGTRSNALTRVLDIIGAYNSIAPEADEILQGSVTDAVIDATERPERIEHLEEAARRLSNKTGQDFTAAPDHVEGGYTARLMQNQRRLDTAWRAVKNALDTFVKSEEWGRLKAEFPGLEDMDALFIAYMVEDLIEYAPEMKEILQEYREQGRDIDFRGLIYGEPPQDAGPEAFIDYVLNRAQEIREAAQGAAPALIGKRPFAGPLRLKDADFLPLLNTNLTNELMRITARDFEAANRKETIAYYTDAKGRKYTIDQFDELTGNIDTSTKKILDAAIMYLTDQHYFRGGINNINPTVSIPLIEYGEANGYTLTAAKMDTKEEQEKENRRTKERKIALRKQIRKDLTDLEKIKGTAERTRGEKAGEYIETRIISSHSVVNDVIRVNFDIDFARFIVNEYEMQFPTVLFRIDNRKPNTYSIGRKLALHNSIDSNYYQGTDCTLSVKVLLSEAPEIPTMQELREGKQRNWKNKIKRPLEKSLNELIETYPMLSRWEYRDPKTGTRYTAEEAQALTWDEYKRLMIDWTMKNQPPGQAERRARRLQEKQEAQEAATNADKKKAKKRGRPRKKG